MDFDIKIVIIRENPRLILRVVSEVKTKKFGDAGNWTRDISHAKRALYPWATSPGATSYLNRTKYPFLINLTEIDPNNWVWLDPKIDHQTKTNLESYF